MDLREGKPTPLLAEATARAGADDGALLDKVGAPGLSDDDVARIQAVLVDTGALDSIEHRIDRLTGSAIDAIEAADVTPEARDELVDLARYVAARDT